MKRITLSACPGSSSTSSSACGRACSLLDVGHNQVYSYINRTVTTITLSDRSNARGTFLLVLFCSSSLCVCCVHQRTRITFTCPVYLDSRLFQRSFLSETLQVNCWLFDELSKCLQVFQILWLKTITGICSVRLNCAAQVQDCRKQKSL